MATNDSPSDQFFIYHQALNAFFHIFERSDWKISVLPYEKLQEQVKQVYQTCGASLPAPPNIPTEADKTAMTDVMHWGHEKVSTPLYQLEVYFNPTYRNSDFLKCFDKNISKWINDYNRQQQNKALEGMIGIGVFVGVVVVLGIVGFFIYKKWNAKKSFGSPESEDRLFSTSRTPLTSVDMNEGYGTGNNDPLPDL